jgi:hypothetical protein
MSGNTTIWGEIKQLLGPRPQIILPLLGAILGSFAILFGYIYERKFYSHFGINVLDYTTYSYFLSVPFRAPETAAWAAVATFVAIVSLRIVLGGQYRDRSLLYQLREVIVAFVLLYAVFSVISKSADTAASALPAVHVELRTSSGEEIRIEEYLMIGRIEETRFFCDSEEIKTIVLNESEILRTTIVPGDSRVAEDCWIDIGS